MSSSVSPLAAPDSHPSEILTLPLGWQVFLASGFLVSLPVFFQAPLVRAAPWVSLVLTLVWLVVGLHFMSLKQGKLFGSLLFGFTLTWLAGSLYWGWLRTEPLLHIPIESIAIPVAIWGIRRNFATVGQFFYIGSLFGTIVTDLYIHALRLLPYWRNAMQPDVAESELPIIFASALEQMATPMGLGCAVVLGTVLIAVGLSGWRAAQFTSMPYSLGWWAFSGAVLSTLLVDGLFGLSACVAASLIA